MRQIDHVNSGLLPQLLTRCDLDLPITRRTLKAVRDRSSQRIATKPAFGTTAPRSEVIATPDGPVCLDILEPKGRSKCNPCLLWLHGGGYIMGQSKDMWNGPLFAEKTGCTVVSVDYRLAPEHPFPAGLNDAFSALNWVHNNADTLQIDPSRIAVGGASAGAGLAAGLALYTRDRGGPLSAVLTIAVSNDRQLT